MGMYANALINLEKSFSLNNTFALSKLVAGLCHSRLNNLSRSRKIFS